MGRPEQELLASAAHHRGIRVPRSIDGWADPRAGEPALVAGEVWPDGDPGEWRKYHAYFTRALPHSVNWLRLALLDAILLGSASERAEADDDAQQMFEAEKRQGWMANELTTVVYGGMHATADLGLLEAGSPTLKVLAAESIALLLLVLRKEYDPTVDVVAAAGQRSAEPGRHLELSGDGYYVALARTAALGKPLRIKEGYNVPQGLLLTSFADTFTAAAQGRWADLSVLPPPEHPRWATITPHHFIVGADGRRLVYQEADCNNETPWLGGSSTETGSLELAPDPALLQPIRERQMGATCRPQPDGAVLYHCNGPDFAYPDKVLARPAEPIEHVILGVGVQPVGIVLPAPNRPETAPKSPQPAAPPAPAKAAKHGSGCALVLGLLLALAAVGAAALEVMR